MIYLKTFEINFFHISLAEKAKYCLLYKYSHLYTISCFSGRRSFGTVAAHPGLSLCPHRAMPAAPCLKPGTLWHRCCTEDYLLCFRSHDLFTCDCTVTAFKAHRCTAAEQRHECQRRYQAWQSCCCSAETTPRGATTISTECSARELGTRLRFGRQASGIANVNVS